MPRLRSHAVWRYSLPRTVVLVSIFAGSPTHSGPTCVGLLLRLDTERLLREARRVSYGSPCGAERDCDLVQLRHVAHRVRTLLHSVDLLANGRESLDTDRNNCRIPIKRAEQSVCYVCLMLLVCFRLFLCISKRRSWFEIRTTFAPWRLLSSICPCKHSYFG